MSDFADQIANFSPKRLALQRAEGLAILVAPSLNRAATLVRPIVWLLSVSINGLVRLFGEAVGLDPDPEMIAEGRRAAQERGIANITWVQALAEDLPQAAPGAYRMVTFGSSFSGIGVWGFERDD